MERVSIVTQIPSSPVSNQQKVSNISLISETFIAVIGFS
jgi:hypothetical protein